MAGGQDGRQQWLCARGLINDTGDSEDLLALTSVSAGICTSLLLSRAQADPCGSSLACCLSSELPVPPLLFTLSICPFPPRLPLCIKQDESLWSPKRPQILADYRRATHSGPFFFWLLSSLQINVRYGLFFRCLIVSDDKEPIHFLITICDICIHLAFHIYYFPGGAPSWPV